MGYASHSAGRHIVTVLLYSFVFLLARAPEKGQVKARKNANKKAIQWIFAKIPYFYVNVLQGGNALVRWVKYLSVGAKDLSVGAKNLSVALPFCCLFFQGIFKKRLGLFSGGLIIMLYVCSGREDTERRTEKRNSEHLGKLQATKLVCAALLFFSTR